MQTIRIVFLTIVIIFSVTIAQAVDISIKNTPPVVVKTIPVAGDMNVDPLITEIKVTFSKDMITNQMWSWV